jgi:hypothetical protein
VLVLLLLQLLLLVALPTTMVPLLPLAPIVDSEDVQRHLCDVSAHGLVFGCHREMPTDCEAQPGDYSQPVGRAALGVP